MAKQKSGGGDKSSDAAKRMPDDQQKMKAKARSSGDAEGDEEEEEEEYEDSLLQEWIKQSPSMLVSLVVHMLVFIGLAAYTLPVILKQANLVEVIPEVIEEEEEEEPKIAEEIVEEPPDEVINAPVPNEILEQTPEVTEAIETDADDPEAEAPLFDDFTPAEFAVPIKPGKSTVTAGSGETGLGSRTGAKKGRGLRNGGGTPGSINAVGAGLRWLKNHQNYDGSWSFNHTPGGKCSLFPNPGSVASKMGATGLALLAFLGDGHTHDKPNKYRDVVHRAVSYLIKNMDASGRLYEAGGPAQTHMYCHGIAACAMAEAYGLTRDPKLQGPAQLALNYIVKAQDQVGGGWRYAPGDPGDTSAVGWQIMAFKSGQMSYLSRPDSVYPKAAKFLDSVQKTKGYGATYIYMPDHEIGDPAATTSIALLCRTYMGWTQDKLRSGVSYCGNKGPLPNNVYFNYYATMFMFQNDGPKGAAWRKWNEVMREQLIRTQEPKGGIHRVGSWYFSGDNSHGEGKAGGRVYHTAMSIMTLQVYYRYENYFAKKH